MVEVLKLDFFYIGGINMLGREGITVSDIQKSIINVLRYHGEQTEQDIYRLLKSSAIGRKEVKITLAQMVKQKKVNKFVRVRYVRWLGFWGHETKESYYSLV